MSIDSLVVAEAMLLLEFGNVRLWTAVSMLDYEMPS